MLITKILLGTAVLTFAFCASLFAWLYLPAGKNRSIHEYSTMQLAAEGQTGLPGTWTSELVSPGYIPLGHKGSMRLVFEQDSASTGSDLWVNTSAPYNIVVEARAEIPSAGTIPSGQLTRVLEPGRPVEFVWQISPQSEGTLDGRVWLYLRYIPRNGGTSLDKPLSVHPLSIRSVTLFGRTADQVKLLALMAFALGAVLALPYIILRSRQAQNRDHLPDNPTG